MTLLARLLRLARARLAGRAPTAGAPELWCRPATMLAPRDPARAPACLAGWR
jgi:hypothetical protein